MPIFQADLEHTRRQETQPPQKPMQPPPPPTLHSRRFSEESLPAELCEGPVPDSPVKSPKVEHTDQDVSTSDRLLFIERLKRGQSPTWIPNRHIESFIQTDSSTPAGKSSRSSSESSSLLPAPQITPEKQDIREVLDERLQDGLDIERPRSALHSGDFTHSERTSESSQSPSSRRRREDRLAAESTWLATSPPRHFTPSFRFERQSPFEDSISSFKSALSTSVSSSFAYQPPTSPLAQSVTNDDLDPAPLSSDRLGSQRRHVFSFETTSPFSSPSRTPGSAGSRSFRREATFPYQAHQPRRSLNSTPSYLQHGISPQTPSLLRARRPSLGSEVSPIQHASMVGSYEESILRGRMSTTPSKPFDFTAQIGVLGKGKCKASLRCPAHVTLPFSAVYYSYNAASQAANDGPSPYVGQIDLENGLPNLEDETRHKRKFQSRYGDRMHDDGDIDMCLDGPEMREHLVSPQNRPKRRRSNSPRAPPGGSYRIPEQGQLQIIIKNQNKTAVKLFLVPYDLTGMTPGTKTFIRQRSYSNGPIIENVPSVAESDPMNRPMLRYLVHLHICCPSRGRFYLYKNARVVFANRVPEGKEKLRNDTTWPEPRFSPYKPVRVMNMPHSATSGPAAAMVAEKAYRRRSSLGISLTETVAQRPTFETMMYSSRPIHHDLDPPSGYRGGGNMLPLDPIPFHLPAGRHETTDEDRPTNIAVVVRSPGSSQSSRPSTEHSDINSRTDNTYEKLNRGEFGYGGNAFNIFDSTGTPPGAEGLLSQRLRTLGVKQPSLDNGHALEEESELDIK